MNPALKSLADDLSQLATEAGWSKTTQFLQTLADASRCPVVALINPLGGDSALALWLRSKLEKRDLVDASANPAGPEMWLAERVVVEFRCGALPSASVVQALAAGPHVRPQGTALLALTGAEQIESNEDLHVVEATARRWLLPPDPAGQTPKEIAASGGYLWSAGAVKDAGLADRLQRDMAALTYALNSPLPAGPQSELAQRRVAVAFQMAEDESSLQAPAGLENPRQRIYQTQEELAELRDRVFMRLRSGTEALEAGIRVASDGLEQDLLAGLPGFIDANPSVVQYPATAPALFEKYCSEVVRVWGAQPRSAANQWERTVADLEGLICASDAWQFVNAAAGNDVYPKRVLDCLGNSQIDLRRLESASPPELDQRDPNGPGLVTTIAGALLGAGAGVVTGLGAPAIVAGLGLGALAGDVYRRYNDLSERRAAFEAAARVDIGRMARSARSHLSDIVAERTHGVRRELAEQFAAAQALLDRSFQSNIQGNSSAASARERLALLRSRFVADVNS